MNIILITMLLGYLFNRLFGVIPRGTLNCGLAGFAGYKNKSVDVTKMRMLLLLNQARGIHATGVYGNQLFKSAVKAEAFIQAPGFNTAVAGANVVIGHTRAGTSGSNTERNNAHPFSLVHTHDGVKKTLHGTHNGGIFPNHINPLCEKFNLKEPEVDSRLIFEILMVSGYNWDVLGDIEANMAIAFIHEGNLHLYRRNNRPLYIGESDEGIYYSSIETSLLQIGCRGVTDVQPWTMFKFKDGIVDKIWHPKKPIVVSLPEDASTRGAENIASMPAAEREELKRYNKNTIGFYQQTGKKKEEQDAQGSAKKNANGRKGSSFGGCISKIKSTSDTAITALIHSLTDEILELIDVHRVDISEEVEELRKEHDSNESVLAINLIAEETNSPKVPQMLVWVDGHEEVNSISLDNGLVILKIPEKLVDTPLDIRMADPFTEYDTQAKEQQYNWYATNIIVPKGRILEVILTLPFLSDLDRTGDESSGSSEIVDDETPSDAVDLSQANIPFRENRGSSASSEKSQGNFNDADVEEVMVALRGQEDKPTGVSLNYLGYDEVTVNVSENGAAEKTFPYINKSKLPIWVIEGYENMGLFIQGSSHPAAKMLREHGGPQTYGKDGNLLPIHLTRIISKEFLLFLGNEMAKAKMNKVKTNEHTFLGSGDLKLKYVGNKSWIQMDTESYVSTINKKIEESVERMAHMGEELDSIREMTSDIGLNNQELRGGLVAAMNVMQEMYNEEEINRMSLKDSIENVLLF